MMRRTVEVLLCDDAIERQWMRLGSAAESDAAAMAYRLNLM